MGQVRLCVVALATLVLAACAGKKELDTAAEKLIAAYEADDYAAFKALVHPEIAEQIPESKFHFAAKALKELGKPVDRSMSGISVKADGPSEGTYTLTFEQAEVKFKLKVLKGTIVSFNIEGDALQKALEKTASAEFKVSSFAFLTAPGGEPRVDSTFEQGGKIPFRMQVMGLTWEGRDVHLRLTAAVLTPDGKVVFQKQLIDDRSTLAEGKLPMATPTGTIDAGPPGSYRLRFVVEDVLGERSQTIHQDITIVPAARAQKP